MDVWMVWIHTVMTTTSCSTMDTNVNLDMEFRMITRYTEECRPAIPGCDTYFTWGYHKIKMKPLSIFWRRGIYQTLCPRLCSMKNCFEITAKQFDPLVQRWYMFQKCDLEERMYWNPQHQNTQYCSLSRKNNILVHRHTTGRLSFQYTTS